MSEAHIPPIIVMGVQGTGKSTIGAALAERLGVTFIDGDDLHPQANKDKMRSGTPLNDDDRVPWLRRIGAVMSEALLEQRPTVVACSALKRWYRELLRDEVPGLFFVHLTGDRELLAARLAARDHEYMPPSLLDSQFSTLQPLAEWEDAVAIDVTQSPEAIVDHVERVIAQRRAVVA